MDTQIHSSSPLHQPETDWKTPKRAKVRQARADGKSWGQIYSELGVPLSSARSICKENSSHRSERRRASHQNLLSTWTVRQIIRTISRNHGSRRLTFEKVKYLLNLDASVRTIRRELRRSGYRHCIACPRPFISRL